MIEPASAAGAVDAERFERTGIPADALRVARIREDFARWIAARFDLDPIRASDLILALNEAMANVAEFAYRGAAVPGPMDVRAELRDGTLAVTVADRGSWRVPDPQPRNRLRGRGIPLIHALADRAGIETGHEGTTVRMEWTGVEPARN
ncbi:ATP-binding protein [uncultured Mycolicibacterium sp.]|uniref:ATP-binding protein n=1 Tax=uncultured Mycolicibacterium sp. TaxID=2320817 RepID=UPI0026049FA3|nr:ATP-binding protein [uncultured Mycolicibacterium sp.]